MAQGKTVMSAMDGGDLRLGVVELEAVGAVADVGRVDLELHPDDEPLAGGERS